MKAGVEVELELGGSVGGVHARESYCCCRLF